MDYQTYAFVLLTNSDLRGLEFQCDSAGCPYPSSIGQDEVSGYDVLRNLHIAGIDYGSYGRPGNAKSRIRQAELVFTPAGILIGIAVVYRVA